jgi:transposase/DNA-binding CsgD family transcriptional regulator
MRIATTLLLDPTERERLESLKRGRRVSVRLAERAGIVLHAADGLENQQIAAILGISRQKAGRWRDRYAALGMAGIEKDAPRPGRNRRISDRQRAAFVAKTLKEKPRRPDALDRTQPGLPIKPGRCGTMTHDYKRNGTTSLFAAMNVLDGSIISQCHPRHRHQEWLKFLKLIKSQVPADKTIHLICDNYATHKHPKVQAWAERNPRFAFHFTPTGASWLNMIERFFRDLSENAIRRGSFFNVDDLVGAIDEYINQHNENPKPFIWTATANDILAKVKRARRAQTR